VLHAHSTIPVTDRVAARAVLGRCLQLNDRKMLVPGDVADGQVEALAAAT